MKKIYRDTISQIEFSRLRGIDRKNVSDLVKNGTIPVDDKKQIYVVEACKILDVNLIKHSRKKKEDSNDQTTLSMEEMHEVKLRHEIIKANREQLKYEEEKGNLVSNEIVARQAYSCGQKLLSAILAVPSRISPQLAAETEINAVEILMYDELKQALFELVNDLKL